jgi:hypothetical protein
LPFYLQVTREDQSRINEFGRLNARKLEIKDEVVDAKVGAAVPG